MIERFREILRPSAAKELHALLKSADENGAWCFWCEQLHARIEELEFEKYAKKLAEDESAAETRLRELGELILHPERSRPSDWLTRWETILGETFDSIDENLSSPPLYRSHLAEAAYLFGVFFPMLRPAKNALEKARSVFAEIFEESLDGSGLPRSSDFMDLRNLLVGWARVLRLRELGGVVPWKAKAQQQFEWAVLQGLRFSRCDLSQVFSVKEDAENLQEEKTGETRRKQDPNVLKNVELFDSLLVHDSDASDRDVFGILSSARKSAAIRKSETLDADSLPETTYFSAWSGIGQLRSGWSFEEPALSVLYGELPPENRFHRPFAASSPFGGWSDSNVLVELNFRYQTVFTGPWNVAIRYGGQALQAKGAWTSLCEICESDHDYYEIECELSDGFRLQRHLLLAHDDEILIMADTVLPQKRCLEKIRNDFQARKAVPAKVGKTRPRSVSASESRPLLEYESRIALSSSIRGQHGEPGANERVLYSRSHSKETPICRIVPLALPEWCAEAPSSSPNGTLEIEGYSLSLRQYAEGIGLFAPLLFDLNPSRLRYPYTWRRLTVGENLEKVPHDKAVGFRVQLHRDQFLLYRSLSEAANRSVLGHNLVSDLYFARFDKTEGVQTIVEVEEE